MTSTLARRLERLEALRHGRVPRMSLVLLGMTDEVEAQYQAALAEGRYRPGDPLMRIILAAPLMNPYVRATP